jgi:hypothetical protein
MKAPPRKAKTGRPPIKTRDEDLRTLALKGLTPSEIAPILNVSQNAVWLRLRTLGLPRNPRISRKLVDNVLTMYFNGMSSVDIMWSTGLHHSKVRTILDTVRPHIQTRYRQGTEQAAQDPRR